jgi:hypothetical protein
MMDIKLRLLRFWIIMALVGGVPCVAEEGSVLSIKDEAQGMYQKYQRSVYQIKIVDVATGNKSAIGSGFQFHPQGYIATNYHVLSDAIRWPHRYRVEYIRQDGQKGTLKIIDVDVVHDIGIVQGQGTFPDYLVLGNSSLLKGTRIFSLGNPFDLGMTIMEGTYNGLMEKALYRKILFSGSINPGMSGGPALDHDGRVIGVNVSTAGNQVSFLVPVEYLQELYAAAEKKVFAPIENWDKHIEQQLVAHQDPYVDRLIGNTWDQVPIGEVSVPGEISNEFKCWGDSKDEKKELHNYAFMQCSSEDDIFLSSTLSTGKIIYKYNWVTSKGLNPIRFYNLYENYFSAPHNYENADKEDADNFDCHEGFVRIGEAANKAVLCARHYKKYPNLYDINLSLAAVNKDDRGLLVEIVALGISKTKAMEFIRKFMQEIKWKK